MCICLDFFNMICYYLIAIQCNKNATQSSLIDLAKKLFYCMSKGIFISLQGIKIPIKVK